MRRGLVVVLAVLAAAVVAVALSSRGPSAYRVAAVFDDARGMVAGQQVKIAGAVVGTVQGVELAPGPKARIVMSIDPRFAPFHRDASCSIEPEGLISENFVRCDPGRSPAPLGRGPGGLPTVPLTHTTVPFSLQDVLNVLSAPTDERLRVLISELGIATAGRGADLNALLRRANPSLQAAQRALAIIAAQRQQLAGAVSQTDEVLAQLASRSERVRQFVDAAAALAQTTARHSAPLAQAVNRLPALLAALRPGLRALDRAATNASPLLDELRASAPGLGRLTTLLPAFASAGLPALRTLAAAARSGIPAVRDAAPVVARLLAASGPLRVLATQLYQLLASSRAAGAFEGLLRVTYAFATNTSLYDNVSHMLTFIISVAPLCVAGQQAGVDVPGCNHNYYAPGRGEIPVNEPSCGPVSAAWWNETCPPPLPGPIVGLTKRAPAFASRLARLKRLDNQALAGRVPSTAELRSLLGYLLR